MSEVLPSLKIFFGDDEEHKVVIVDYKTLAKTGEIAITGPVDDVEFDPGNCMVYADHDDGTDVWVIDAKTEKIVATVTIPEAPEYIQYDRPTDRLYQNIKRNNTIQVIDPAKNKGGIRLEYGACYRAARFGDRPSRGARVQRG